jgi:hypothetical protein
VSRRTPDPPVDAQRCNSVDFAGFDRGRLNTAPKPGKEAAPDVGDISDAAPRLGLARHAEPHQSYTRRGSI